MADNEVASLTLRQVLQEYLDSLAAEDRVADVMYVEKFCDFVSQDLAVHSLTGSRVDSFVEQHIKETDPNAPERVRALKRWFQYLKRKEHTATNLGARVRLKRQARSGGARSRSADEAPLEMTQEGIAKLERELKKVEGERPELLSAIARAREDKDFRENAPLDAAREALGYNDGRLRELKESLKRAVVVEAHDDGRASVGSTVNVTQVDRGTSHTYVLVNPQEANARESRISVKSPVGAQLLGRSAGDEVIVDVPSGTLHFRVDNVTS